MTPTSIPKFKRYFCLTLYGAVALIFLDGPAPVSAAGGAPASARPAASEQAEPLLAWHDTSKWGLEGRAFEDMARLRRFDRLPAVAEGRVTDQVWELSHDSAGMMVRFKTDTSVIWARYSLLRERLAYPNMTAIAASGLDFYARDDAGQWRWAGIASPKQPVNREEIASGFGPGLREYAVYLPLGNGIEYLSIGVAVDARFEPLRPREEKPIVFYGTSITQGTGASRPGMVHTAILGRRFDRPVVNLGFAGHGHMDIAVGELLVKIDAAVYVIDCLPNMTPETVREKCIPLVKLIRTARPDTPIVLVEDRRRANTWLRPRRNQQHTENHAALKECYSTLQRAGVTGLYYLPGDGLWGDDTDGTADGSHPNDLGYVRQANAFEPVLRAALFR